MKIAERVLLILILVGILLKIVHIPGGNILTVLSVSLASVFYLIGGYFLFDPKKAIVVNDITYYKARAPRVVLALITGYTVCMAMIGILFKLMHWPGAAVMILIGGITILPIAIISIVKYSSTKEKFYRELTLRSVAVTLLCGILFFVRLP